MMRGHWVIAALFALGVTGTIGAAGMVTGGTDKANATPPADGPASVAKASVAAEVHTPEPRLDEKLDRVKAEYETAIRQFMRLYRGSTIPEENLKKAAEIEPNYAAFVRRITELAETAPKDAAVRDAMLWVIKTAKGGHAESGEFALAANWLVRQFGDDPDAVRVGLDLDNWPDFERDNLLFCFYASAKSRESKGLARLALAQYLEKKAMLADGARKVEGRPTYTHDDLVRADGTLYTEKEVMPDAHYAYLLHLKQCDVAYLRAEAERLYEEVISQYADVPYIKAHDRVLEAILKQPQPTWRGEPLTDEVRRQMEAGIARRRSTLGQVAEDRLDDWHNLAVGKVAPEIKGVDVHGKPLALSAYRGKVVALVFWATWCGPCMREVPREKTLVEHMKGRPFAMLGVNVDAEAQTAFKAMETQGMTWPNLHDGMPGEGPIAKLYHVRGYPTVYVIDAAGKIRSKKAHGEELGQLVEKLVAEKEAAGN
jgi:thiol-disulfide isomerase/thioredoxin